MALADDLRASHLVHGDPLVCDVRWLSAPDCATVDALARLQLTARRRGQRICLRNASRELVELLALAGLCGVLPDESGSGVQVGRKVEEREEPGRVQEKRDARDSTV
jgi:anti-anti-sigma regulatory factor